jgi:hypothetical protein
MGVQPTGNQLDVLWFSWLKFEGDKIVPSVLMAYRATATRR